MTVHVHRRRRVVRLLLVAGLASVSVALTACSSDDTATPASLASTTTSTPGGVTTTGAPGAPATNATTGPDACARLQAALAGSGTASAPPVASGVDHCRVDVTAVHGVSATGSLELTIRGSADSATFEDALADPSFGDPTTLQGLGDMAAAADDDQRTQVFALSGSSLFTLIGGGLDHDLVIAVARAVVAG